MSGHVSASSLDLGGGLSELAGWAKKAVSSVGRRGGRQQRAATMNEEAH